MIMILPWQPPAAALCRSDRGRVTPWQSLCESRVRVAGRRGRGPGFQVQVPNHDQPEYNLKFAARPDHWPAVTVAATTTIMIWVYYDASLSDSVRVRST